jgi:hypothetical protein
LRFGSATSGDIRPLWHYPGYYLGHYLWHYLWYYLWHYFWHYLWYYFWHYFWYYLRHYFGYHLGYHLGWGITSDAQQRLGLWSSQPFQYLLVRVRAGTPTVNHPLIFRCDPLLRGRRGSFHPL